MVALYRRTVNDVLRSLSAIGARVECRGEKIVLRAGARPVPIELVEAARAVKVELAKVLNRPADDLAEKVEHLGRAEGENPRVSAAPTEGAQMSTFGEYLRCEGA
jgi:hypothetical protein